MSETCHGKDGVEQRVFFVEGRSIAEPAPWRRMDTKMRRLHGPKSFEDLGHGVGVKGQVLFGGWLPTPKDFGGLQSVTTWGMRRRPFWDDHRSTRLHGASRETQTKQRNARNLEINQSLHQALSEKTSCLPFCKAVSVRGIDHLKMNGQLILVIVDGK